MEKLKDNNVASQFAKKYPIVKILFEQKKYLEVIKVVKKLQPYFEADYLDYTFFDNKAVFLIYEGISYIELGLYEDALDVLLQIEIKYEALKKARIFWRNFAKKPINKNSFEMSKHACELISDQMQKFNDNNSYKYLSNIAYACFKLERYQDAIKYYKRALRRRKNKKDMLLNLGIAEAQYELYKGKLPKNIKKWYTKTIDILSRSKTDFDTLLAIGKMYYFLKDYDKALNFVQRALELTVNEPQNKVYAYDWLSRIAYKKKNHSLAIGFYEDVIRCLVEYPDSKQGMIIHPKPQLYMMIKFLNDNKRIVKNKELRGVWYTVIAGLVVTVFFGVIDNHEYLKLKFLEFVSSFLG